LQFFLFSFADILGGHFSIVTNIGDAPQQNQDGNPPWIHN